MFFVIHCEYKTIITHSTMYSQIFVKMSMMINKQFNLSQLILLSMKMKLSIFQENFLVFFDLPGFDIIKFKNKN